MDRLTGQFRRFAIIREKSKLGRLVLEVELNDPFPAHRRTVPGVLIAEMNGVLGTGDDADAVEVALVGIDDGLAVHQLDGIQRTDLDAFTRPAAELGVDQKLGHGENLSAA
jgi:hypothetical protein